MPSIYLDNASTTFPKPQAVPDAMYRFMTQVGSNIKDVYKRQSPGRRLTGRSLRG